MHGRDGEKDQLAMRTFDQILTLLAKFAEGIAGARSSPEPGRESQEQFAHRPDDQRARPAPRDDDNRARPPSGSYPAVWPR